MSLIRTSVLDRVAVFAAAGADVPADPAELESLTAQELLAAVELLAQTKRVCDRLGVLLAGAAARRSHPSLGGNGLARREGFRTVEEFVKTRIGVSGSDAVKAIRIGRILHDSALGGQSDPVSGELTPPEAPWLSPAITTLTAGTVSVDAVDAIAAGLGSPSSSVTAEVLTDAVEQLCAVAADGVDPDRLRKHARQLRDDLDLDGVAVREAERYEERFVKLTELPTGMFRLSGLLPPEQGLQLKIVLDRATSPKRGGPSFIDAGNNDPGSNSALAERILRDIRTPGQLCCDALVQLAGIGADANPDFLLGTGAPVLNLAVTEHDYRAGAGRGYFEGASDAVSIETVERVACAGGILPILFDEEGQPLDVGRERRLFTWRQKRVLAARDGGCRWHNCDRTPLWSEAHHIDHWHRDHGKTDTANGILLCRHHHLKLHNEHYEIIRKGANYWLKPPVDKDPDQTLIPMPSKSRIMHELQRQATETRASVERIS